MEIQEKIKMVFETLNNARDLGGLTGADGRKIKKGMLMRSAQLYEASDADLEKLADLIDTDIDFRTIKEIFEVPEPRMAGVRYVHLPAVDDLMAGVTRDKQSDEEALRMLMVAPDLARDYMCMLYEKFLTEAFSLRQYAKFVRILLEDHEKAVLWHCTAGKDRAGFAAILILEILGVSRDQILEDYQKTNPYMEAEIRRLTRQMTDRGADPETSERAVRYLWGAMPEYPETVYRKAEEVYGGFDGFIRDGLGIRDEERTALRQRYLED